MPFSQEALDQMGTEFQQLELRYERLFMTLLGIELKNDRAREFARQGLGRRLKIIVRCIQQTFEIIPPDRTSLPNRDELSDAAIFVQAFIFNVFGSLDNLAWTWVLERNVTLKNGQPIPDNWIGLRAGNVAVRQSLSANTQKYLDSLEEWMKYLEGYRHALAHRIPLYIPPYTVSYENAAAYDLLQERINAATRKYDLAEYDRLSAEQDKLAVFTPWIKHSFEDGLLADFRTIEEVSYKILDELKP